MPELFPPHGGLTEPVDRMVPAAEVADFRKNAASLKKVPISDADLSSLYRFGDGGLSPLTGPMDKAAFDRVLDEEVIVHNGKKYAWTIPISFPVDKTLAADAQSRRNGRPDQQQERDRRHADDQRHLPLRQGPLHQERLRHAADRSSRRPHGHGRSARDAARRRSARVAAAQASGVRPVRAVAARDPGPVPRTRLDADRRVPDAQSRCTAPTNTPWSSAWNG